MKITTPVVACALCTLMPSAYAATVEISLTPLSGVVADGTRIYRADLSAVGINELSTITLTDNNSGIGGSPGEYSGYDLDAIKLSYTLATTSAEASAAPVLDALAFTDAATLYSPGTQRPPADAKLAGTNAQGTGVDFGFATLGDFDGIYFGPGSVTLGDGGSITFNLSAPVSIEGLYLYLGEVSGEETLAGTVVVSDVAEIPLPAAGWLLGSALIGLGLTGKKRAARCVEG